MKMIVIGLDSTNPEILFKDEQLTNFRRLMESGCYGKLEGVVPATSVPAWMCMITSQDPGSLGVYGFHNRADYSYNNFRIATSESMEGISIWDQVSRAGKQSIIVGVPPSYPPLKVNGIFVSYDANSNTHNAIFTYPEPLREEITEALGEYPVEVKSTATDRKDRLREDIYTMSRKQFEMIRYLMQNYEWDYFQFVDLGLDRLQQTFRKPHGLCHAPFELGTVYEDVIADYYLYLDNELGKILTLLDDDTAILIVCRDGAQGVDGDACVNEWLVKEELLVLKELSKELTSINNQNINWERTKVWSQSGQDASIFLNVKGREPRGTISRVDYEKFRNEIKTKLEESLHDKDNSFGIFAFKPDEIYKSIHNIPPDLIVQFGRSSPHSIGSVENRTVHTQKRQTGREECDYKQFGSFILAVSNRSLDGEIKCGNLLDLAPTLLELGGYDIPVSMQGKSMIKNKISNQTSNTDSSADEEGAIRQRLKGLGYI